MLLCSQSFLTIRTRPPSCSTTSPLLTASSTPLVRAVSLALEGEKLISLTAQSSPLLPFLAS